MTDINYSFDIPKDYYFFIREAFNDYSKYIKQYKIISSNYTKKLIQFQEKFGQPLLDLDKMKNKYKKIKANKIFEIISVVPIIIQKLIDNFNSSITDLDNIIQNVDKILAEKINIEKKDNDELEFDNKRNSLIKYYKNIDKNKNLFINKMSNVEDYIYKYYSNMNKPNKTIPEEKNKKEKEKNDILITRDLLDLNIKEAKKMETQYFSSFEAGEDSEKSFNIVSQKSKQKLCKYSLNLTLQLKQIIIDTTIILKNNFSEPLNEIAIILEKFSDIDKNINFTQIINDSFDNNKMISKRKPKKYKIKLLNEPKLIEGKKNPKYHIVTLEDGFDILNYYDDYSTLYTINALYENFDLIEKDAKFDMKKEYSKIQTRDISQKILSYINKGKDQITDTGNINCTQNEIKQLKDLIDDHPNRVVFLQDLNTFRSRGLYGIPKDIFDLFSELFLIMCKTIGRDKDYHTAKNIIVLSETYYYLIDGNKHYLQEIVKNNDIFKNYKFWEGYMQFIIEKEIIKSIQNDKKNGTLIKKNQKESDDLYSTVVFSQLITAADNMINFNFESKKIKEIMKPLIKHYNINEESIQIIDQILYKNNNIRQSMFLNDEIKLLDVNKVYDYYKNFDVFGNDNLVNINENPDDEINKAEKLEDIFNNQNGEKKDKEN
jgi:hypothetical protein